MALCRRWKQNRFERRSLGRNTRDSSQVDESREAARQETTDSEDEEVDETDAEDAVHDSAAPDGDWVPERNEQRRTPVLIRVRSAFFLKLDCDLGDDQRLSHARSRARVQLGSS